MAKAIVIILGVIILYGAWRFVMVPHMLHLYGPGYTPERDMDKLLAIADASRPFREALERFKIDQGHYPAMVTNLFPSYLQPTNTPQLPNLNDWAGWFYIWKSTNSYELYYQLEWDGGLWYEHMIEGTNQWLWSTSDRAVDLTTKCGTR